MDNVVKQQIEARAGHISKLVDETIRNHKTTLTQTTKGNLRELMNGLANVIVQELVRDIGNEQDIRATVMKRLKADVIRQLSREMKKLNTEANEQSNYEREAMIRDAQRHEAYMANEHGIDTKGKSRPEMLGSSRK